MKTRAFSIAILCSVSAFAQQPTAAEKAFREGREAMRKKEYGIACDRFGESQRLEAAPGTMFGMAECEEKLGKLAQSWRHVQQVLKDLKPGDPLLPLAQELASALDKRVARLSVKLTADTPADAKVRVDGVDVAVGTVLVVDPGEHKVTVHTRAGGEAKQTVLLKAGHSEAFTLAALVDDVPPVKPDPEPSPRPAPHKTKLATSSTRTMGWVSAGIGATAMVGGGVFLLLANSTKADTDKNKYVTDNEGRRGCDALKDPDCDAAWKRQQTMGLVALGVGAVGVGLGVYWIVSGEDDPDNAVSFRVGPWATPSGAGSAFVGRW